MNFRKVLFVALWLLSGSAIYGQTTDKKTLTLDGAERVIAAAKAKAEEVKAPGGVIAVVDVGGVSLGRCDNTLCSTERQTFSIDHLRRHTDSTEQTDCCCEPDHSS